MQSMPKTLTEWLSPDLVNILLVLFLSFLIGLEREERKAGDEKFAFGGVRTFPLIGLAGYAMALLSGDQLVPLALGLVAVGGFLLLSYWHKLTTMGVAGVTSEIAGLITYLIGALVFHQFFWVAITLGVATMLLLELKIGLEGLTQRIALDDIYTFTKFLLLTAVILPIVPDQAYGPFQINPFKTWLVVAAVSAVSYGSYVIGRLTKGRGGIILAAILGGAYSSTLTTVVLAKRSRDEDQPHAFAGGTLVASGMMYLRLAVLLALFSRDLMALLAPSFIALGGLAIGAGWLWSRRSDANAAKIERHAEPPNPLEIGAAVLFALFFLAMLVATHLAAAYLGQAGVYTLAAIMGVTDVDPFIMGMTQAAGAATSLPVAAAAILIAAASNNLVKGAYAYFSGSRQAGLQGACFLAGLAVLGLLPLLW